MSGLSRQLPWAAACLAALCVLTAAENPSPDPTVTAIPLSPNTSTAKTTVPTTVTTLTPVTTPAQGGRRPNGFPVFARPPLRAEPPALPAVRAGPGPGRAALQQHGGPSESSPGWDRSGGGEGAPRGVGAAEPRCPLGSGPPRSVPRQGALKKCLVIPSLTSAWDEGRGFLPRWWQGG